jgi:hypothetical protein
MSLPHTIVKDFIVRYGEELAMGSDRERAKKLFFD